MSNTETFQHYQVLKNPDGSLCELGRGAMGVTYKAFDTNLRCNVALKVINTAYLGSEMAGQRFLREARAAAGLSHPNVASVFHLGQAGGNYFYAMEFIDGETLESFVKRRGPLPPVTALKIALQVARALRAADRLGLVHRDIKPANLMLVHEDEDDELHVKVIDFGLAKLTRTDGADASGTITVTGFVGTPHFASPEQLEEKDLDARSDIYSLGITLWYMLAGRPPFSGSMVQVMSQHLTQRPPFERLPGVPAPVMRVLERMLEKDSSGRPQTPSDLRRELEQALAAVAVSPAAGPDEIREADPAAADAPPRDGTGGRADSRRPEPGAILDSRYRLVREVARDARGVLFQATDLDTQAAVALRILAPEILPDAETYQRAARRFTEAKAVSHPSLLELFALTRTEPHTFVAFEWVDGLSLLDVLRHRPVLSFEEVSGVLRPLAAAADALKDAGTTTGTEIVPGRVLLSSGEEIRPDGRAELLSTPLVEWPACQPKVFPLRFAAATGSTATWSGQQTMVPAPDVLPSDTTQLTFLAYELLGGNVSQLRSTRRFSPLPNLSEAGNETLRAGLLQGEKNPYRRAGDFVDALIQAAEQRVKTPDLSAAAAADSSLAQTPDPIGEATPTAAASRLDTSSAPLPGKPSEGGRLFPLLAGATILLLLLGALAYFGLRADRKASISAIEKKAAPTATASTVLPPVAGPSPSPSASPLPIPSVAPSPVVEATPVPTPVPDRAARLAEALAEARRLQEDRQMTQAFSAYIHIAEEFPESDEGLGRIDSYISALQADPLTPELEQRRFQQLQPSLERAAHLGSDMAMLFLADHLRGTDPEAAARWYHHAADKGRPEAMVALGDMYFLGVGVAPDPAQTAHWYERASDKGYIKAKVDLAECYEMGKGGVKRDFNRSFQLLNEALGLEPNEPHALEKLGLEYELGRGTAPDKKQAFALMKRASDLGNTNATANLGIYYINGIGTPKNAKVAVQLFKEGADKNNAGAMFFYAQCLQTGLGGLSANKAEAANYFRASAEQGFALARDYCRQNRIPFAAGN